MIRLDTTTLSLEAILAGAVTLNQLQCYVTYSDASGSSYSGGSKRTLTNGVTAVTIAAAPGAGIVRDIDYINIYNNDTVAASVVVRINDNGTFYTLRDVTLNSDDCLTYTHARGWFVTDLSGSAKELLSGATFGNVSITGVETYTAVGNQQVISQDASKFREAQQSTLTSGTAYTTNGSLLIMKAWTHNTGIDTSGNLTVADATDFCSALIYSEDDKIKGFGSSAAVTGGTTPTISNTWYLDNIAGSIISLGTGGIGYGTGAGGTVTQATSKSTAVTLNKPTGKITTFNDALASGAIVQFSFNNSLLAANDILVLNVVSGTAGVNYSFRTVVNPGIAYIVIKNETAGSLSESIGISFAIIKGVIA